MVNFSSIHVGGGGDRIKEEGIWGRKFREEGTELAYERQMSVTLHNIQIDLRNTFMLLVLCTIQLNSVMYYALILKFSEEGTEAEKADGRENLSQNAEGKGKVVLTCYHLEKSE